jgi:ferredoxin
MIISQQKPIEEIVSSLEGCTNIFLIGCGECATTCKSGGREELAKMQEELTKHGKVIVGACVPDAPCVAAKIKTELAKNMKSLRQADAALIFACGLGVQSVKDNDRLGLKVFPGTNTLFGAVMDAQGNFYEKCSMCGDCVLGITSGVCPVTLCPKGILNGPCGGMDKGKCEVDKERDCAWVLIYKESEKKGGLSRLKDIQAPRDNKKSLKPRKMILTKINP